MFKRSKSLVAAAATALICATAVQPAGADISTIQAHFAFSPLYGVLATYDIQNNDLVLQTSQNGSGVFGSQYGIQRGEAKIHVAFDDFGDGNFVLTAWNIIDARF